MTRHNGVGPQPGKNNLRDTGVLSELHASDEVLSAYIDNQLDEAERIALEERLKTDAVARGELARLQRTVGALREVPDQRPSRSFVLDEVTAARLRQMPEPVISAPFRDAVVISESTGVVRSMPSRRPLHIYLRVASALVAVLLLAVTAFDLAGTFTTSTSGTTAILPSVPTVHATRTPPPTCNTETGGSNCAVSGAGTALPLPNIQPTPAPVQLPQVVKEDSATVRLFEIALLILVVALAGVSFVIKPGNSRQLQPRGP